MANASVLEVRGLAASVVQRPHEHGVMHAANLMAQSKQQHACCMQQLLSNML